MPRTHSLKSAQIRWPKCGKKMAHHPAQRERQAESQRGGDRDRGTENEAEGQRTKRGRRGRPGRCRGSGGRKDAAALGEQSGREDRTSAFLQGHWTSSALVGCETDAPLKINTTVIFCCLKAEMGCTHSLAHSFIHWTLALSHNLPGPGPTHTRRCPWHCLSYSGTTIFRACVGLSQSLDRSVPPWPL